MWYPESDGGGWYEGTTRVVQPKTYYVSNGDERIDCDSMREARVKARNLNEGSNQMSTVSTHERDAAVIHDALLTANVGDDHTDALTALAGTVDRLQGRVNWLEKMVGSPAAPIAGLPGSEPEVPAEILIAFPATHVVHWPSGPVHACKKHASAIVGLGNIMGGHTAVTASDGQHQCMNCKNEAGVDDDEEVEGTGNAKETVG